MNCPSTPSPSAPAEVAPAEVAPAEVAPAEVAPAEVAFAHGLLSAGQVLTARGISVTTQRHFGIQCVAGMGFAYPTRNVDGSPGPQRMHSIVPQEAPYRWVGTWTEAQAEYVPVLYNLPAIKLAASRGEELYIVQNEFNVWSMQECQRSAVCLLDVEKDDAQKNLKRATAQLQEGKVKKVRLLFNNDLTGREQALAVGKACVVAGIEIVLLLLDGPLGDDVGALFARCGFDPRRCGEALDRLDIAPVPLLRQLFTDPGFGLPPAPPDSRAIALFECLDRAALEALSLPEFAVEGFVLAGRPTILYGQAYTGKSIIALDMSLCLSAGLEWNGRRTQAGLTFYVAGEGANGLKKRVAAWRKHYGASHPEHFYPIDHAVLLDDPEQRQRLIATIEHHRQKTGLPARLVVFDTLNKCLSATDENSSADVTRVFKAAESICLATGAAVLILHHPNRQGEVRGSTVMPGDTDGLVLLEGEGGSEVVRLKAIKVRDFSLSEMTLRCHLVTLEEMPDKYGQPSTSVVFVRDDTAQMPGGKEPGNTGERGKSSTPKSGGPSNGHSKDNNGQGNGQHATGAARQSQTPPRQPQTPLQQPTDATVNHPPLTAAQPNDPAAPSGLDSLSDKEVAAWEALVQLCAGEKTGQGVTLSSWESAAQQAGVSASSFKRAKSKLLEKKLVRCDALGQRGARFAPTAQIP